MNKKLVSTLVMSSVFASVLTFNATSASALIEKKVLKTETGEIHTISGDLGTLKGATAQERAFDALNKLKADYGIKDAAKEFKVKASKQDSLKNTHTRMDRQINGIPVFGSQLIVHEKNGRLTGVSGKYKVLTPNTATATVSKSDALNKAVAHTGYTGQLFKPAEGTLVYLAQDNKAILTYKVNVNYLGGNNPGNWDIFVNATDGSIVKSINKLSHVVGTGTGVLGDPNKKINTVKKGSLYYLEDRTKAMYLNGSTINTYTFNNGSISQTYMTDADNQWNAEVQKAGVDAHYYAGVVYDFYKNNFNRNSYDGNGATIISGVHYSSNYDNAFWNGVQMVYGDGSALAYPEENGFISLSGSLDVIGHELTHAVTEYSAGLVYEDESGALNESWSDVFGVVIENRNWAVGEDVYSPLIPDDALRYMDDPEKGGQPAKMSDYYPDPENRDNGGVHTNSGIPNKAFYNFATAIGSRLDAAKVWYGAYEYLTPYATFVEARVATLQACENIYGAGSTQYSALQAAWDDVEVYATPTLK